MEWTLAVFLNISGSEHWFRKLFHEWKWPPIQLRWSWLIFQPKTATTDDKIPNSKFIPLSLLFLHPTHSWKMLICDCEDEMEILAKLSHLSGIFIVVCGCYRCRRLLRSFVGTFENFFLSSFSSPPSPPFDVNLFSSHAVVDCMLLAFLIMFSVDGGVKQHNNSVRKKN